VSPSLPKKGRRNPVAKALRLPQLAPKRVPNLKAYQRKPKHPKREG
jgi:hypothetical protein